MLGNPVNKNDGEKIDYIRCPVCREALVALSRSENLESELSDISDDKYGRGEIDDLEQLEDLHKAIHAMVPGGRGWEVRCPHCSEPLGQDTGKTDREEDIEYITAHCSPCEGDWIVTTEKTSGKAAGVGGTLERTRLTCPYCGDSFIVK